MVYDISNLPQYSPSPYRKNKITKEQIICDIDKTYLETKTSSFLDLAKTALEKPGDKKTILGASEYLDALLWSAGENLPEKSALKTFPRNLHFVSASPPQLRKTLEEKFILDKLYWSSITLKNQLYNIKKIKFHLLREQISYKTIAIFNIIEKNPNSSFFLIGDNSESDPYIYAGIKQLKDGVISHKGYIEFLSIAGLTKSSIRTIVQSKGFLKPAKINNIFIRDLKPTKSSSLDRYLIKFNSYRELLLYSYRQGYISSSIMTKIVKRLNSSFQLEQNLKKTQEKQRIEFFSPEEKDEESKFLANAKLWYANNHN